MRCVKLEIKVKRCGENLGRIMFLFDTEAKAEELMKIIKERIEGRSEESLERTGD
ncbi:MAG: hypothetical protein N3F04_06900 [Candidatus Nezhaarchaeota archaeon]|nr:hypothetical protein [Candidatus Nezhaarchaeota archaeon]